MRWFWVCFVIAMLAASPALAQTPSERAAAETVIAASEPHEGRVALDLALAQLRSNDGAGALEPARRALALSESESSGVDPIFANFVLGRAEFAAGLGAGRLRAALTSPTVSQLPPDEIYVAASQLALSAFAARNYAIAEEMWAVAAAYPSGAAEGAQTGRGVALSQQAASIFYAHVARSWRLRMDTDRGQQALGLALEGMQILRSVADMPEPGETTDQSVRRFGQALAVMHIIKAKLVADGTLPDAVPDDALDQHLPDRPARLSAPACRVRVDYPRIWFPGSHVGWNIGTVAVLLRFRDGQVENAEVVAQIGEDAFVNAVRRANWTDDVTVERTEDSPPDCQVPASAVTTAVFYFY